MRTIAALVVAIMLLWGTLFVSGVALLVWRQEPYAGTDYLARCFYAGAGGLTRIEHRSSTLAEMQRFECGWRLPDR